MKSICVTVHCICLEIVPYNCENERNTLYMLEFVLFKVLRVTVIIQCNITNLPQESLQPS